MAYLTRRSGAGNIMSRAASQSTGGTVTSSSGTTYVAGRPVSVSPTRPRVGTSRSYGGGSSGGGGVSAPAPVYNSSLLQQSFSSKDAMQKAETAHRVAQEKKRKEELKKFSATGGLQAVGESQSRFLKPSAVPKSAIKTDSRAIKQATEIADQITRPDTKGMATGKIERYEEQGTGQPLDFIAPVSAITQATAISPIGQFFFSPTQIETARLKYTGEQRRQVGEFVAETGITIGVAPGIAGASSRVATVVTKGVSKGFKPVASGVGKILGSSADDVFKILSKGSVSQAGRITLGGTGKLSTTQAKVAAKKILTNPKVVQLIKTEGVGEGLRQAGLYSPELASQVYLVTTPDRVFNPTKETEKIAGNVYTAARVEYYGGTKQIVDDKGNIVETQQVAGKAPMGESFAEGFLPGIKVATGFAPEFREQVREKLKNDPEYQKLSGTKKKQYADEFSDYYLNVQQIGQTVGQIFIETGGEVTGGGRLKALGPIGSRKGAVAKFGLASGSTGVQEGVYSVELGGITERRPVSTQEKILSGAVGGAFAGGFGMFQAGGIWKPKFGRIVNITGELADYPGEPLGDVLGAPIKKALGVADIQVKGSLVKTSFGVDILGSQAQTQQQSKATKKKIKGKKKVAGVDSAFIKDKTGTMLLQQEKDAIKKAQGQMEDMINQGQVNINIPGQVPGVPGTTVGVQPPSTGEQTPIIGDVPDEDPSKEKQAEEEQEQQEEQEQTVSTSADTFVGVPSTVGVVAPQGFLFPGFFPIGSSRRGGVRQQTKIYDELAAAGKRLKQLSGLRRR